MSLFDEFRLDRSKFSVGSLDDEGEEKAFWQSKTPQERLTALEFMRQVAYGYDPDTTRMVKILEVVQRDEPEDQQTRPQSPQGSE